MEVELLHAPPRDLIVSAIRTCWKSFHKEDGFGDNDTQLIRRIIRFGHTSTLEHIQYTFYVTGLSRAILQELARHRIASFSVESTRYTLKRILNGEQAIEDLMVDTGDEDLNELTYKHMRDLKELINRKGLRNDTAKYGITENYPVNLQFSMNIRSLRNFITLRTSSAAHKEIRSLAFKVKDVIPIEHNVFFEDL